MIGWLNKILKCIFLKGQLLYLGGIMVSKHWIQVSIHLFQTTSNLEFLQLEICFLQGLKPI